MKKFLAGLLSGWLVVALLYAAAVVAQPAVGGLVCGPVGIGCFVLRTVPGTAASPSQTSILDTTTGDFYPATGLVSTAASGVEMQRYNNAGVMQNAIVAAVSNAAGQTLTAAQLLGGIINRTGVGAGQTDTTDTAALIFAAMGSPPVGMSFTFEYVNTTANAVTLAGGTNVTLVGNASLVATGAGVGQRRVTCVVTAATPTFSCFL